MKRWIIGLRCAKCGARYFLATLNGGISQSTNQELAEGIEAGDIPFVCENSDDIRLEFCTCNEHKP